MTHDMLDDTTSPLYGFLMPIYCSLFTSPAFCFDGDNTTGVWNAFVSERFGQSLGTFVYTARTRKREEVTVPKQRDMNKEKDLRCPRHRHFIKRESAPICLLHNAAASVC